MALYDGFFDFDQEVLESTGKYDREYGSEDFTALLDAAIGSGVYVGESAGSMAVTLADGKALVAPGYLFLQGYWLANRAGDGEKPATYPGYYVALPDSGRVAIAARLDLGRPMVELVSMPQAETYPDSLVLALIDVDANTVTDTRADAALCGLVDSAGSTAAKAAYAVQYIDKELEGRLEQAEADIAAKSAEMDAKIAEVGSQLSKLAPPPVGTVKFTASENVDADWLPCDGSFINEADYPDLVAALGKLIPSGDKFKLLSDGEIPQQISNGVLYGGRMWVYSYSAAKLYGIDVEGEAPVKEVALTSEDSHFTDFVPPTVTRPICLSITPHIGKAGAKLFLSQIIKDGGDAQSASDLAWLEFCLLFQSEFTGEEESLTMAPPFASIKPTVHTDSNSNGKYPIWDSANCIPFIKSFSENGTEVFRFLVGYLDIPYYDTACSVKWTENENTAAETEITDFGSMSPSTGYDTIITKYQRYGYSAKSLKEAIGVRANRRTQNYNSTYEYDIYSSPNQQFSYGGGSQLTETTVCRDSIGPMNIVGEDYAVSSFDINLFPVFSRKEPVMRSVEPGLNLPSGARVFVDGAAYLWGKSIYMFFVGTGIIFSRTLEKGSFGYLDTTSVLGAITQFGYLDYSQDEGTLYLLGQDTTNKVKLAKIVLNTLYDYANDGAWLPQLASDGVPAYIKAKAEEQEGDDITDPVTVTITVLSPSGDFDTYADIVFNGTPLLAGTYTRALSASGTFTVGMRGKESSGSISCVVKMNGNTIVTGQIPSFTATSYEKTATFNVSDYVENGITLQGTTSI